MNGFRFYAEYDSAKDKRTGKAKNVVAAFSDPEHTFFSGKDLMIECISGVFNYANSPVASTSASFDYLRQNCKRISEAKAREIHPELFARLDAAD